MPAPKWLGDYWQQALQALKRERVPGLAMVVVDASGHYHLHHGHQARGGKAIDANTLFRLASVSKTLTAAVVLKDVYRGALSLDSRYTELMGSPGLYQADALRLEHVLGQTSGYMPNAYDNLIEANYSLPRMLGKLKQLAPICKPGRCYTYQNLLFAGLQQHYERAVGGFDRFVTDTLFTPLNLPRASVGREALVKDGNWARPHVLVGKRRHRQVRVKRGYYRVAPAAGINASGNDMARVLEALLGRAPLVLPAQVVDEMLTPRVVTAKETRRKHWRGLIDQAHYGLGLRVYQLGEVRVGYHGGWVQGYRASLAFSPELGLGVAFLMNAGNNVISQLEADFWRTALQHVTPPVQVPLAVTAG